MSSDQPRRTPAQIAKDLDRNPLDSSPALLPPEPEPKPKPTDSREESLLWLGVALVVFVIVVGALAIMGVRLPS